MFFNSNASSAPGGSRTDKEIDDVMCQEKTKICDLMRKCYITKINIFDAEKHADIFPNQNHSQFGLTKINFLVDFDEEKCSDADISLFSTEMTRLFLEYDYATQTLTYDQLIDLFMLKAKEMKLSNNKCKELYRSVLGCIVSKFTENQSGNQSGNQSRKKAGG